MGFVDGIKIGMHGLALLVFYVFYVLFVLVVPLTIWNAIQGGFVMGDLQRVGIAVAIVLGGAWVIRRHRNFFVPFESIRRVLFGE